MNIYTKKKKQTDEKKERKKKTFSKWWRDSFEQLTILTTSSWLNSIHVFIYWSFFFWSFQMKVLFCFLFVHLLIRFHNSFDCCELHLTNLKILQNDFRMTHCYKYFLCWQCYAIQCISGYFFFLFYCVHNDDWFTWQNLRCWDNIE